MNDFALLGELKGEFRTWGALAARLGAEAGSPLDVEAIVKWRKRGQIALRWRPWVLSVAKKEGVLLPHQAVEPPRPAPSRAKAATAAAKPKRRRPARPATGEAGA